MDIEQAKKELDDKPDTPRIGDKKPMFEAKKHYALYGVIAVLVVLLGVSLFSGKLGFTGKAVSEGSVKLDFYVMSQCPYGTQVEDAIAPVLEKFGDSIDFSINFIANDNGDGTFDSLHGQPEVDENLRQACAMKIAPKKYIKYILCQNKNIRNAGSTWQSCASEAGLDAGSLKTCSEGAEGKLLLSESIKKSEAVRASGSPTIKINTEDYNSGRDTASFIRAICQKLQGHTECASMPECTADAECTSQPDKEGKCVEGKCAYVEPVQFDVIVVNDAKCGSCDPTGVLQTTRTLFKGANIRTVDISSDEGKKLASGLQLKFVPSYLFSNAVTSASTWASNPRLQTSFEKKGDWYKLLDEAVGASHWIDEKARQEALKALGITLGDNRPTVDLFVMSQCPYGVDAENAFMPVLKALGKDIEFRLNYIANDNNDGTFKSLHGQAEVDEDIRQLCAKKLKPDKYLDYIACQNKDARNVEANWEKCAVESGINKATLKTYAESAEGRKLLSDSTKLAAIFGAGGSPSIFIDGESYNGARSPAGFQSAICSAFDSEKPEACSAVLENVASNVPAGGGCA